MSYKSFRQIIKGWGSPIRKDATANSVHVPASVNSEDRKRRMFNETIAAQSVSQRRRRSDKPSQPDGSKAGDGKEQHEQDLVRGVKPTGKRYWNDVSRETGAVYPRGSDVLFDYDNVYDDDDVDKPDADDDGADGSGIDGVGVEDEDRSSDDDDTGETEKRWRIQVAKADIDQRLIYGWASVTAIDGEEVVDKQDDIIPTSELERAVVEYVLTSRDGGDMHTFRGASRLVESFVFTPEKERLGIVAKDDQGRVIHGWWTGFKVDNDDLWAKIKRGERPEFSIGGQAHPIDMAELGKSKTSGRARRLARGTF
jgi:hypothetical protein